jgi:hypothetical protein
MSLKKYDDFDFSMEEDENTAANPRDAWKQIDAERRIIGVERVSAQKTIGVVAVENTAMKYWTVYMAPVAEKSHEEDALYVADYGAKLGEVVARAFFPHIAKDLKYKLA